MKINFRLKDKSKVSSYLFADILFNGKRIKYSLKINVLSLSFDEKKQRIKGNSEEASETNLLLSKYENDISKVLRVFQCLINVSPREIKSKLDELFRTNIIPEEPPEAKEILPSQNNEIKHLTDYVLTIIDTAKVTKKPSTIKSYLTTLNKLKQYEKTRNEKLSFNSIDYAFYGLFVQYCKKVHQLAPNTLGGHIKNIKVFMKIAFENGDTDNIAFKRSSFKTMSEEVDSVYLNDNELERLKTCVLPSNKLENVRDIFLIVCYIGLRISDYKKIDGRNIIHNGNILKVLTAKTNEEVFIPLNSFVKSTLAKYDYSLKMISDQKFNEYIKEVCRLAGIDELITYYQTKGDAKIQVISPKYSLITSHTARRSFATNAFLAGVPTLSIMKITGHKTEKSFLKYIKVSKEENAKIIMTHSFFR
jgi:site-specific recombinase XerD